MKAVFKRFNQVSKSLPVPIYQQIKETIEQGISEGHWEAGEKLPSEHELVDALGVSRMTINRALSELTQKGAIKRVQGVGSFVGEPTRHASLIELQDIALEISRRGRQHRSEVLSLRQTVASIEASMQLEVATGSKVFFFRAVHFQDELPVQLETRYVNPEMMPEFIQQDFKQQTTTAYLLRQFKPDEMEHRVKALMPDPQTRKHLLMSENQPCLNLTRRTWKRGQVVTYVTLTYPGDRYGLGARYATGEYQLRQSESAFKK